MEVAAYLLEFQCHMFYFSISIPAHLCIFTKHLDLLDLYYLNEPLILDRSNTPKMPIIHNTTRENSPFPIPSTRSIFTAINAFLSLCMINVYILNNTEMHHITHNVSLCMVCRLWTQYTAGPIPIDDTM